MKKQILLPLTAALYVLAAASSFAADAPNKVIIHADLGKETISRFIYGHFAEHLGGCIYGGIWVGEDSPIPNTRGIRNDVVAALREIKPAVIRWPGGCFADTYHWMDGIGPRDQRPSIINTTWGGVTENNHFGTHEFLDFCEMVGAEPYICLNVGSGTVREASDWVEYVTSDAQSPMTDLRRQNGREKPWKVRFWAVGNESWGCGGNMTPEYYSDVYKLFSTFVRGHDLYRVASSGQANDYDWTEVVMQALCDTDHNYVKNLMQVYSFHYYTFARGWNDKTSALQFDEADWFDTMRETRAMEKMMENHMRIMDLYDPQNQVGLIADEWGNWYNVEPGSNPAFLYQQNTMRDAVTAALYLNIFNNHCGRVKMANIAQTVNVLQSMILTRQGEMVRTPTFHVFKMFAPHQDATLLPVDAAGPDYTLGKRSLPALTVSASRDASGKIHVSLANLDPVKGMPVVCDLRGIEKVRKAKGEIITAKAMNAHNDFGKPEEVKAAAFTDLKVDGRIVNMQMPAKSVIMLELE